ncbi:hypothetical protein [Dactylosporangium sp. CS-033363]|uniref:hypothetical protein n=1 Tax=Dactylosporangium sp. CS-033363 TaxID=3239935 RepID=UPI003D916B29
MNPTRTDFEEIARKSAPPSRLSADGVYAEAFRRQRNRTTAWVAGGVTALLLAAGTGGAVLNRSAPAPAGPSTSPSTPATGAARAEPQGPVVRVEASDAEHLYATVNDCTGRCRLKLIGTDDGGRTWTVRQDDFGNGDFTVPVPGVLFRAVGTINDKYDGQAANGPKTYYAYQMSSDGGRTWRGMQESAQAVAEMSAGGWLDRPCWSADDPCLFKAFDPVNAKIAPLKNQPPIDGEVAYVPTAAGLWVAGTHKQSERAAVAVSHDRGRTWTTREFGDAQPTQRPSVVAFTADGVTGYVIVQETHLDLDRNDRATATATAQPNTTTGLVQRTADGGQTWQEVDLGHTLPVQYTIFNGDGFVAGDGTHVVFVRGDGPVQWVSGKDGTYQPGRPAGLGEKLTSNGGHPIVITVAKGLYLAFDSNAAYRSADGRTFTRIPVDVPR